MDLKIPLRSPSYYVKQAIGMIRILKNNYWNNRKNLLIVD